MTLLKIRPRRLVTGFAILLAAGIQLTTAHPDLIQQIVQVTEQMNQHRESAGLFCARAELFRRHGQFEAALNDLAAAERLNTNATPMRLERARVYCDSGHAQEALVEIQFFLTNDPHHSEGLLIRARSLARLGRTEEAIADYNVAIQNAPAPAPDLFLERAHLLAGLGRLAEAAQSLDSAISNAPFASPLQLTAIEYDRQRRAFAPALARVDELVNRYPVKEPWLTLRAEVLEQSGQTNEARQTFAQVLTGIESYPAVRRSLDLTRQLENRARQGLTRLTVSKN